MDTSSLNDVMPLAPKRQPAAAHNEQQPIRTGR